MNRPSVRASPASRLSDSHQPTEDPPSLHAANGKTMEDWRSHGDPAAQEYFSPSKPHQRFSENGNTNGHVKHEDPASSDPTMSNSGYSSSPQGRSRKGYALSLGTSMLLSFVSIFIFIGMLGTRNPGYNLQLVPSLGAIHRPHRRIQAEFGVDPFKGGIFYQGSVRMKELQACDALEEDLVPCYSNLTHGEGNDRQCGNPGRTKQCLIPPPVDYKIPFRWPVSKNSVWHGNMKLTEQLGLSGKRMARLKLRSDDVVSLDMGQIALDGLDKHVQSISKLMSVMSANKGQLQVILDLNCGLSRISTHNHFMENAVILCVSSYEVNGSQVQFSLERGLPAVIGSLVNAQLPLPSLSFDMIHCFDCDFDRTWKDGILLLELDRLLKPGGLFVWGYEKSTAVDLETSEHQQDQQKIKLANEMCWSTLSEDERTVIRQKTTNDSCYASRGLQVKPKLCNKPVVSSSGWYPRLLPCLTGNNGDKVYSMDEVKKTGLADGFFNEELADLSESNAWSALVKSYWSLLSPLIFSDHPKRPGEEDPLPPSNIVRNVMDMNALYGSLNVALLSAKKSVWVMNVVPRNGLNTLPAIYAQGLIGIQHDWCEPFPTYPRTYDLLHGIGILSQQEASKSNGCGLSSLLLEMDRILRPEGWVILRDRVDLIEDARTAASQMRWESRVISVEGHEEHQLLVCQKTFWKALPSSVL